jgi:uncharacterized protein YndB with AHSA1/START domain
VPTFDDTATIDAPVEEVWKLLYDPARLVEWWEGIETVVPRGHDGKGDITIYPDGYPDFPMPQEMRTDHDGRTVTISCLVSDLVFDWRLVPVQPGDRTRVTAHVEIPEREAHRVETQRAVVAASLRGLAALAATGAPPARG